MTRHSVLIAGGGPTGLMLAGELALAGVDVAILERRLTRELAGSRAGGLHARSIEVLDQRGIADRFLSQGQTHQIVHFHIPLDISDFPTRHPYLLALFQIHIERILGEWVNELNVPIYRGREVTGFSESDDHVVVDVSGAESLTAQYLVGCDGGRSTVRKAADIDFPGWDASRTWLIAEVQMQEEPAWGMRETSTGRHGMGKVDSGAVRLVLTDREVETNPEPTLSDVSTALVDIYGTDFGVHSPTWISRFSDTARQAAAYRKGRVLLAGDAAHIHAPIGGQGLNIGMQDAVNLGWKLAQVIKGISPASLLDSYHNERHPVAARVLWNTMALVAVSRTDERSKALGDFVAEFVSMSEPRKRIAAEMSGLGTSYHLGEGHPLLGRRMPDLDLSTGEGPTRVFSLLHNARPVLLNVGQPGSVEAGPWANRVHLVDAKYDGTWDLPAIGVVASPAAVLIRPDGYVAWVGDGSRSGLDDALETWFGAPDLA